MSGNASLKSGSGQEDIWRVGGIFHPDRLCGEDPLSEGLDHPPGTGSPATLSAHFFVVGRPRLSQDSGVNMSPIDLVGTVDTLAWVGGCVYTHQQVPATCVLSLQVEHSSPLGAGPTHCFPPLSLVWQSLVSAHLCPEPHLMIVFVLI